MRPKGCVLGWLAVAVLLPQLVLRGDENANAPQPAGEVPPAPAVTDLVYIGWEKGCVVHRLSTGQRNWSSWKGPRAFLPRTVIATVSPHAAAALSPTDGYSGWLFDLRAEKWAVVPKSPIAPPNGVQDPIATAFIGETLVVWGADDGEVQGAALDMATMNWMQIARAPVVPR